jgi:VWFA-related protein
MAVMLLAALSSALSLNAIGQATRARQVTPPKPDDPQAKPTPQPKPAAPSTTVSPATDQTQQPPKKETTPPQDQGVIKISSNLVVVPVSITDAAGQPVRNLTAEDFKIEEEGQAQQLVTLGEPGKTPVELALIFDASGSVRERFEFEQQAASRFLKSVLKPNDTASVFSIGLAPKLVRTRTTNMEEAVAGVMAINPTKEATAFFDSIVEAAHYLGNTAEPGTRRVIVVISDGEDNHSERYKLADARRELQRTDCLFYSLNPSGPSIRLNKISLKGQENMVSLATDTGGAAFVPDKIEELEVVFSRIAAELQAQYMLGYYSSDERSNGAFRRITVRVPKRPDLRVRARQGYYAPKSAE